MQAKTLRKFGGGVLVLGAALWAGPVLAAGPVDIEAGALYWMHDLEVEMGEASEDFSADAPALFGEVWINKLGFTADWYQSEVDEPDVGDVDVDYKSLDARWKIFEVPGGNFVAVGAGLQQIDISGGGESFDSTGFRLVADAKVGLGRIVYAFGEAAIWTGLDDFEGGEVVLVDPSGQELEFGISVKPAPFFNIKAGYRRSTLEYDIEGQTEEWTGDGFFGGVSFNF
jgi:hypothetical protein